MRPSTLLLQLLAFACAAACAHAAGQYPGQQAGQVQLAQGAPTPQPELFVSEADIQYLGEPAVFEPQSAPQIEPQPVQYVQGPPSVQYQSELRALEPLAVPEPVAPFRPLVRSNIAAGKPCGTGLKGVCMAQASCGAPRTIQYGHCAGSNYCCMPAPTPAPAPAKPATTTTPAKAQTLNTAVACGTGMKGQCIPQASCGAPRTIMYGQCAGSNYCCMPAPTPAPAPAPTPAQPTGVPCGTGSKGVCIPQASCGAPRTIMYGQCAGDKYCCMPAPTPAPAPAPLPAGVACGTGSKGVCIAESACGAPRTIMYGQCAGDKYCCMPAPAPAPAPAPLPPGVACGTDNKGVCVSESACGAPRSIMYGQCAGDKYCCMPPGTPISAGPYAHLRPMDDLRMVYDIYEPSNTRAFVWSDFSNEQKSNAILLVKYAKQQGFKNTVADVNAISYVLGTAAWESLLTPIREYGGPDAWYAPYYGRGFVQLTHDVNYEKCNSVLKAGLGRNVDLVADPDLALDVNNAAYIAIYGMKTGLFTGVALIDYFSEPNNPQWISARAIINGENEAEMIANIAKAFRPLVFRMMASSTHTP